MLIKLLSMNIIEIINFFVRFSLFREIISQEKLTTVNS